MTATELVILGAATWRLSSLLVNEEGPFDIFERFRSLVGVQFNDLGESYGTNSLARLLLCIWCLSPWIAAGLIGAWFLAPQPTILLSLPFALSAGAIALERWNNGSR